MYVFKLVCEKFVCSNRAIITWLERGPRKYIIVPNVTVISLCRVIIITTLFAAKDICWMIQSATREWLFVELELTGSGFWFFLSSDIISVSWNDLLLRWFDWFLVSTIYSLDEKVLAEGKVLQFLWTLYFFFFCIIHFKVQVDNNPFLFFSYTRHRTVPRNWLESHMPSHLVLNTFSNDCSDDMDV